MFTVTLITFFYYNKCIERLTSCANIAFFLSVGRLPIKFSWIEVKDLRDRRPIPLKFWAQIDWNAFLVNTSPFRQDNQSTWHMLHINMLVRQHDYCAGVPRAGGDKRSERQRVPAPANIHQPNTATEEERTDIPAGPRWTAWSAVCEGGCDATFMASSSALSGQFERKTTFPVQRKICCFSWKLWNVFLFRVERSWTL